MPHFYNHIDIQCSFKHRNIDIQCSFKHSNIHTQCSFKTSITKVGQIQCNIDTVLVLTEKLNNRLIILTLFLSEDLVQNLYLQIKEKEISQLSVFRGKDENVSYRTKNPLI